MWEVLIVFILVILLAATLILRFTRGKITGGGEPAKAVRTMLFNGMGNFHYWLVQERLARAGFVNLEHENVIEGVLIAHANNLPPVDYLRLDVNRYDASSSVNYDLLSVRTRVINKFERESRRGLVVKHLFHEKMRGRSFYPRAIDYVDLKDNLDRVWILRPSTTRAVPGAPIFYSFGDVFIVHDADSLARAQVRYAEIKKIAGNELHISVTEYLKPALIRGRKFTLALYMLVAKNKTGTRSICNINTTDAFIYLANSPYEHDNFTQNTIHYPIFDRRYTQTMNDFPAEYKKSVDSVVKDIEAALCEIGRELTCPANSESAYEIFTITLLIDEAGRAYVIEVAPRTAYTMRVVGDNSTEAAISRKRQETLADWEAQIVLDLMSDGYSDK